MSSVEHSPEKQNQLDSMRQLVQQFAARFLPQEGPWWVSEICPLLIESDGFPLTGTEFGLLVGLESTRTDTVQLSLQCRPDQINRISKVIALQGKFGEAASETLDRLTELAHQPQNVPIDFAVGTSVGESADIRLYVGSLDRMAGDLAADLREIGIWQIMLSKEAVDLVDRIKFGAKFMGFSKRFGLRESYLLYFLPTLPLTEDVLDYVIPDTSPQLRFKHFLAKNEAQPPINANDYGWGVAVDSHGNLLYLKLELKIGTLRDELVGGEAVVWLQKAALDSQLQAIPYAISCGVNADSSREVVYFAFDSIAASGKPTLRNSLKIHRPYEISKAPWTELEVQAIAALELGLDAIVAKQSPNGAWEDFALPYYGKSDFWTTAHVGFRLATLPPQWRSEKVRLAIDAAEHFLQAQGKTGWGFNSRSPVDADSTAHVMLFFQAIGAEVPPETIKTLQSFWMLDEGFATFLQADHWPAVWCTAHPDVTPVALHALAACTSEPDLSRYANSLVRADYFDHQALQQWPAFWWNLDWYTLAAWCRCLKAVGMLEIWIQTFTHYLDEHLRQHAHTKTWVDEALKLEALHLIGGHDQIIRDSIADLISGQTESGLWPSGLILRMDPQFLAGSPSIGGALYATSIILTSLALRLSET